MSSYFTSDFSQSRPRLFLAFRSPSSIQRVLAAAFEAGPVAQLPWSFHRFRYRFSPTIYHAVVNTKICAELLNGLCSDVTEFDCVLAELIVIALSDFGHDQSPLLS